MPIIDLFNFLFLAPITNLLIFIIRVLDASSIPGSLGLSIIILTFLIRVFIWPLMTAQLKSAKKLSDLKPHLDTLKKTHEGNKQALAQAQMALYKEHGVNPAGGCLPALIQIPIFIALYQVIFSFFSGDSGLSTINQQLYVQSWHLNSSPNPYFLGFNLGDKPSDFSKVGVFVLLIPILTGFLQFIQSKMMTPTIKKYPSDSPREIKDKNDTEDAMTAMQGQMVYLMPVMIGYFAFSFPIGLAIYWNTFSIISIWQQYKVAGFGGIEGWVNKFSSSLKKNR